MKKTSLMVAAGLMILATACKENTNIVPAHAEPSRAYSASQSEANTVEGDSIYVNIGKGKPVKVKVGTPVPPYKTEVAPVKPVE